MKATGILFSALFALSAHASPAPTVKYTIDIDSAGKAQYFRLEEGNRKVPLQAAEFALSLSDFIDKVKEIACGMPARPDQIFANIGVAEVSWNTATICDKK